MTSKIFIPLEHRTSKAATAQVRSKQYNFWKKIPEQSPIARIQNKGVFRAGHYIAIT